jgi:dihydrofolate reductase
MEFRHDSWSAARDRLLEAGVGWCVAETDEKDPKPEDLSWEPVGYLRLRKTEYSDEELSEWSARIQPALDSGATIFCYFKHEDEGASPKMAKRLEAMLDAPPRATMPQVAVDETAVQAPAVEATTGGKTQYFTATSIDGYIADADNSLDWLFQAHDDSHDETRWDAFIGAVGAMAMGATTYEWVLEHEKLLEEPAKWHEFYGEIPCWVFTHRELPPIPDADLRFVQGDVRPVHEGMRAAAAGKNIWLVGGGELVGQFADQGLLDELQLHVAPVTLGGGAPLLPRRITAPRLQLLHADAEAGFAYLTYAVSSDRSGSGS